MRTVDNRTLDPRSPLVLDTHDLSRRPGSMRTFTSTIPAPAELGSGVIGVPEGADLDLDLRLESVMEGVLVSGTISGDAVGECVRCLEEVHEHVDVHVAELFVYSERAAAAAQEAGEDDDEADVYELVDECADLEPVIRDAVVMALPFRPLCQEDCRGLCSECGVRLSDPGNEDHHHDVIDPRWKALQGLAADDDTDGAGQ